MTDSLFIDKVGNRANNSAKFKGGEVALNFSEYFSSENFIPTKSTYLI